MTFQFQPPNAPPTPPAQTGFQIPGQVPQPSPAAALAAATAGPAVSIEQAIAASMVGSSQVGDRNPELPGGDQFDLTITDIRAQVDRQAGLSYYIDVKVAASGGVVAIPPGTICTAKIRGFNNPDAVNFAIRDIRAFTRAALKSVNMSSARATLFADADASWTGLGVPPGWVGDDARWAALIAGTVQAKACVGQRLFCKSATVRGRNPAAKSKVIYEFFAP